MRKFIKYLPLYGLILSALSADTFHPNNSKIAHSGRIEFTEQDTALLGYSGTRLRISFEGKELMIRMRSKGSTNWLNILQDGEWIEKIEIDQDWKTYPVAFDNTAVHKLELIKATEGAEGIIEIDTLSLENDATLVEWDQNETRKIEFIGDSITCGYGIETNNPDEHYKPSTENFCDTYAWHTANALNADYLVVARSGIGMIRNYNGPFEGSKENLPYLYDQSFFHHQQPKWDSKRFTPDVVCINLGTNDFSTTGVNSSGYEKAYLGFVNRLLAQYDHAKIVCLLGPMLNDPKVKDILQRVVKDANQQLEKERVFHFEMTAQGPLGYGADWHPSKKQALLNGKELTAYLQQLMSWE